MTVAEAIEILKKCPQQNQLKIMGADCKLILNTTKGFTLLEEEDIETLSSEQVVYSEFKESD